MHVATQKATKGMLVACTDQHCYDAIQGSEWAEDHPAGRHSAAPYPDAHPELLLSGVIWRDGPRQRQGEGPLEDPGRQPQAGLP